MTDNKLPEPIWSTIVQHAVLVSIDLIIQRANGEVLLGFRNNAPAQHTWFVPGGVIRKTETLDAAFERIALHELGVALVRSKASVLGVFEHQYEDNFSHAPGFGTHYVVIAHTVSVPNDFDVIGVDDQHTEMRWWAVQELLSSESVHRYTKAYFKDPANNS
jgi:colanic acid biosynthesis protein WcaH